jgi:hypothetical protein
VWLRAIEDPHERGDPVGMDRVRAVLGPLMLRRTKGMVDKVRHDLLTCMQRSIQRGWRGFI